MGSSPCIADDYSGEIKSGFEEMQHSGRKIKWHCQSCASYYFRMCTDELEAYDCGTDGRLSAAVSGGKQPTELFCAAAYLRLCAPRSFFARPVHFIAVALEVFSPRKEVCVGPSSI